MLSGRRLVPGRGRARRDLLLAIALGTLAVLVLVVQVRLLSGAVDAAFLRGAALRDLVPVLVALAAAALVKAAFTFGGEALAARAAAARRVELRSALTGRLLDRGPVWAGGERSGELAHTLMAGIESTDAFIAQYLPQAALAVLAPALILAFVFRADPLSGVVLLVTYPLIPVFMWLIGGAARERTSRQWVTRARLEARFLESLQGIATLKALGRSRGEASHLAAVGERFREVTMGVLKVAFLSSFVLELVATLSVAVIAVEIGLRLLYGHVPFREALFVLIAAPEFYKPLRTLGASFHAGMAGSEAGARIFALLPGGDGAGAGVVAVADVRGAPAGAPAAGAALPAIVFDSVVARYAPDRAHALDRFSLSIPPGSTVALVGPSGAGKSTVAALLLRFLDAESGTIEVGGRPLAGIGTAAWRARLAYVPQRPRLFHGSVLSNLTLGSPGATREQAEEAARRAGAHEFIRKLPRGYDTPVGEDGSRLSGGEAQRIALARALLRDAGLVILDEPTAHLDAETEAAFVAGFEELRAGRTVLLIAHRFTASVTADHIAVLKRGRIVEEGDHERLLRNNGLYRRLFAAYRGAA